MPEQNRWKKDENIQPIIIFKIPKRTYYRSPFQNERIELSQRFPSRGMTKKSNDKTVSRCVHHCFTALRNKKICQVPMGGDHL